MPDGWKEIALALIAATTGGIGWWVKSWREDRKARTEAAAAEKRSLQERAEKLEAKVESLLMDAIAQARETNAQMTERIQMDARQNDVISAATEALKENAKLLARLELKS